MADVYLSLAYVAAGFAIEVVGGAQGQQWVPTTFCVVNIQSFIGVFLLVL